MKKLLLVLFSLLLLSVAVNGEGTKIGVGAFGGMNIPILQDDQASGTAFGVMVRIKFLSFMSAEPNAVFGKWGEPGDVDGFQLGISGSKVNSFGVDGIIGSMPGTVGLKPYAVIGVGSYKIKNDDTGYDESNIGFSGGLGFGIGVSPKFDVDLRGKFLVIPQDQGSKKALTLTGGLLYYLGSDN